MGRKKNGSSLIYVIIIFMFITTVSTAVLSMVSGNYTARVIESKRVENLYGSDSGIDVAYNILGKTFDAATKYGYYRVKRLTDATITDKSKCTYGEQYEKFNADIDELNSKIESLKLENKADGTTKEKIQSNNRDIDRYNQLIEEDKNYIEVLSNEEFKSGFKAFFDNNDSKLNNDFKLNNSIENKQFVYQVGGLELSSNNITTIQYEADSDIDKEAVLGVNISEPYNISTTESDIDSYGTLSKDGHIVPATFTKTVNKAYSIKITSNFRAKNDAKIVGDNNRTVEATYVIKIPNYDDIFFGRGISTDKYLALKDRSLAVGNKMNVENVGQLTISGDVFVQGQDPNVLSNDENRTYEKYSGGITINNSSSGSVEFKNNVITRNTFNIQDNTTATIDRNLYGRNIYLGKIADGDLGFAQNSKLYIKANSYGKVVLDNDLTVKAKNSEINMNDFYGINDKNIKYVNTTDPEISDNLESDNVTKSSSSIIINGYKGGARDSKVTINNSAYIMGTAHIATENNYQTGESGAVKDNYIAYSVPNPRDSSETFDYDSPLYLLNEDNVFKKAKHFKNYWTEQGNADTGGIIWPSSENIFSIGAIVYKVGDQTFIKEPNYTQSLEREGGKVYDMRKEFAAEVYKFGQSAEIGEYNKSVLTDFNSLMDLSSISDYTELGDSEKAVFNSDDDITIVLQDKDKNTTEFEDSDGNKIDETNIKIIKADRNNEINAVIATAGNVIIDGDVKFKGTIICKKDLIIKGNNNATIDYDSDVIFRLQSQNEIGEKFRSVFGGILVNSDETSNSKKSEEEILNTNYDINRFMESKLWKLKK